MNNFLFQGVVIQTVKDVNQSLIDDGLVCTDKIGAANFFWSFPAKVYQDKLFQKENLSQNLQAATKRCDEIEGQIENAKLDRKSSDRPLKIKRLNELYAEEKEVDAVIEENKFNDPAEIGRIKNEIHSIVDCINRWTDNTFAVKKFLVKKANRSGKEVNINNYSCQIISFNHLYR